MANSSEHILVVQDGSAYDFSCILAIEMLERLESQFRDGVPDSMFLPGITIFRIGSRGGHHVRFDSEEKRDTALNEYVAAWKSWEAVQRHAPSAATSHENAELPNVTAQTGGGYVQS